MRLFITLVSLITCGVIGYEIGIKNQGVTVIEKRSTFVTLRTSAFKKCKNIESTTITAGGVQELWKCDKGEFFYLIHKPKTYQLEIREPSNG